MNVLGNLALAAAAHHIKGPHIDWAAFSPIVVLAGGALLALMLGLVPSQPFRENVIPVATMLVLGGAIAAEIIRFDKTRSIISGALQMDHLAMTLDIVCAGCGIAAAMLAWRSEASKQSGEGEFGALILFSALGMAVLVSSQDLVTLFLGLELLSIPLYILCAADSRREGSLESGLKYLIIGSVGSATLLYGLAMIYGATGHTDFAGIAQWILPAHHPHHAHDAILFVGIALSAVGFAFKASIAPFHQWTPDVYEGAPTSVTAFMATATKAAAFGVIIRFFDGAVFGAHHNWVPLLATVGAITIIVGNVGALGQTSVKRMLGYSGVAQAGYMLAGVIVYGALGIRATVLYLIVYALSNLAAFAAISAAESEYGGDDLSALSGLGARKPLLAWPLTIAMLSLAGIPGTVGFIGKFQLIHALVDGNYTWYAVVLVIGSMISLGYYLRVIAAMWMGPAPTEAAANYTGPGITLAPIAGGSPEADALPPVRPARAINPAPKAASTWPSPNSPIPGRPGDALVAVACGAACIVFGVIPQVLFVFAAHASNFY